jgi:hypothetical protein
MSLELLKQFLSDQKNLLIWVPNSLNFKRKKVLEFDVGMEDSETCVKNGQLTILTLSLEPPLLE